MEEEARTGKRRTGAVHPLSKGYRWGARGWGAAGRRPRPGAAADGAARRGSLLKQRGAGSARARRPQSHPPPHRYSHPHPSFPLQRAWWYVTVAAACFTGWLEPFKVAYLPKQCW
jgi:hypothetical protein